MSIQFSDSNLDENKGIFSPFSASAVLLRWNKTGITVAGITNTSGNSSNELNEPWDLVVDWSYALYVTDKVNNRVQKFSRGSSIGVTVAGQASSIKGYNLSYLNRPFGIAVDDYSNVYVTDNSNSRIVLWSDGASVGSRIGGNGRYPIIFRCSFESTMSRYWDCTGSIVRSIWSCT